MSSYLPVEIASIEDDELHRGFFEACRQHRLTIQHCDSCSAFQHPPRVLCSTCRAATLSWVPVSGRGTVYTYTVVHHGVGPFAEFVPYNVVAVALEGAEGVRLVSNLMGVAPGGIFIGMKVEVAWDDLKPELTLPRFRPADSSS